MDYSDEEPDRYWITRPEAHGYLSDICKCDRHIDMTKSVCMTKRYGSAQPLCQQCATADVKDHPMTVEYIKWMTTGDPRWWSAWLCNCEGCVPDDQSSAQRA